MKYEARVKKLKIKKGDKVKVITGKDVGKEGEVEKVLRRENKIVVTGINLLKKHVKKRREGEAAGIVTITAPIRVSNVMFICSKCNKPTRVGYKLKKSGGKVRICRRCGQEID